MKTQYFNGSFSPFSRSLLAALVSSSLIEIRICNSNIIILVLFQYYNEYQVCYKST